MKNFDSFELEPESNRLLACGIDEHGRPHKTPIFRLTSIGTAGDRVIACDINEQKFVLKTTGMDGAKKKLEELEAFIQKHFKNSPSFFMP